MYFLLIEQASFKRTYVSSKEKIEKKVRRRKKVQKEEGENQEKVEKFVG